MAKKICIEEFLKRYMDKEIIYIPNPGNAGDALIAFATLQLFKKVGLRYIIGDILEIYRNSTLFYGGGGNLIGIYHQCESFLNNNKPPYLGNQIVVLPHTIASVDDLLHTTKDNVIFICRELISCDYVSRVFKYANNVLLADDIVFSIENLQEYASRIGKGTLNCFRTDCERIAEDVPEDNEDLSVTMNDVWFIAFDYDLLQSMTHNIFSKIAKYDTIHTNRLHMAIVGSLLNKKVYFHSNSYYKCKAVYEYSIKDKFPNTTFFDKPPASRMARHLIKL